MIDRETELQALNTDLTNEVRMLRAQLGAAKALMRVGFIERPMSMLVSPDGAASEDLMKLYERIELLEKDAWTQTGAVAKQFVKASKNVETASTLSGQVDNLDGFIKFWAERFRSLVGDD